MTRKDLRNKRPDEVIPPGSPTPVDTIEEQNEQAAKEDRRVGHLVTLGDIRREMAQVYRAAHKGTIKWEQATKRIWVLRGLLATVEVEERYRVPDLDPDERPVFTGLVISGPAPKLNGSQGPDEGKQNGEGNGGS